MCSKGIRRLLPLICFAAVLAIGMGMSAQEPPPAPTLTKIDPDRAAVGDLLTLTGEHFAVSSNPLLITFTPDLPVAVAPGSDTQISVTVPAGAKTGPVTVTTTASYNGQDLVQKSNAVDILVFNWTTFDLTQIHPLPWARYTGFFTIFGGLNDDVYAVYDNLIPPYPFWFPAELWHIFSDGSFRLERRWMNNRRPSGMSAVDPWTVKLNPLTGQVWGVWLSTQTSGAINFSAGTFIPASGDYTLGDLGFDGAGNMYCTPDSLGSAGLWKFAPGEPLNLSEATNLLSGLGFCTFTNSYLAVTPDGTAYISDVRPNCGAEEYALLELDPPGSNPPYYVYPPSGVPYWTFDSFMATDCMNRSYFTYMPESLPCSTAVSVQRKGIQETLYPPSAGEVPAHLGLAADGYGDLYLLGNSDCGNAVWWAGTMIKRIAPQELTDPHYYDDFDCCPTSLEHEDIVQKRRDSKGELVKQCATGELKIKVFPDVENPDNFTWPSQNSQTKEWSVNIPLGLPPRFLALWKATPASQETEEVVTWQVSGEHVDGPLEQKALYQTRPEHPLTGADPIYRNKELVVQTVHRGYFTLTATPVDAGHKATFVLKVKIVTPTGLGNLPHGHDAKIIEWADKYGIPPQYIKGQILQEQPKPPQGLDDFKEDVFRYEPITRDYEQIAINPSFSWTAHDFSMYKLPPQAYNMDFSPRETYKLITHIDFTAQPPAYTCAQATQYIDGQPADPISLYQFFAANDGWHPGDYPWTLYGGRPSPCGGPRINWSINSNMLMAWHLAQFYCGQSVCGTDTTRAGLFRSWLQSNSGYVGQTALCSSYGLMQVIYLDVVKDWGWRANDTGANRRPSMLFEVDTNLSLGIMENASHCKNLDGLHYASLEEWRLWYQDGINKYDSGLSNDECSSYGACVFAKAQLFKPYKTGVEDAKN